MTLGPRSLGFAIFGVTNSRQVSASVITLLVSCALVSSDFLLFAAIRPQAGEVKRKLAVMPDGQQIDRLVGIHGRGEHQVVSVLVLAQLTGCAASWARASPDCGALSR